MWNKIKNYDLATGQGVLFTKGTGRWMGAFTIIFIMMLFLDTGSDEINFSFVSFYIMAIPYMAAMANFWKYGGTPNLIKRLPLSYKEEVFYSIISLVIRTILFICLCLLVVICINVLFGELTFDIALFFNSAPYSILYQISLGLFIGGTFYPLSFTNKKRLFWITAGCFIGAIILYNIGVCLLLNDGTWNFKNFLRQFNQKPNGMWISLLSFGLSVVYAVGGILTALKIHRPKRYDR